MQAFEQVKVVEVGELGALRLEGGAAGLVVGEHRRDPLALHRQSGGGGGGDARVAFAEGVVVGAHQEAGALVALGHRLHHRQQVARVPGDHRAQARGLVQRSGRGVALGHEDHAGRCRRAQHEEVPLLREASRPEFLGRSTRGRRGLSGADDLQAVHPAVDVEQRDDQLAGLAEAHTVGAHALAHQVLTLAFRRSLRPAGGGDLRGAVGFLGAAAVVLFPVLGEALLQRGALVGAQLGLPQLDLLRVAVVAAPHAVGADDQQRSLVGAQLVQVVPPALLAVALHLAPLEPPDLEVVDVEPRLAELAHHIVVVVSHGHVQ